MNVAVIDLGTNTFNLLICSVQNGEPKGLYATKEFVQLGKGGINKRIIQEDSIARAMKCLSEFQSTCNKYEVDQILAFGTSAIRNAENGADFVGKVKDTLNIDIRIIDGKREAELIKAGAIKAIPFINDKVLIMDVGGGSTEFIICDENETFWSHSFEIGAARLYEKYHLHEPIKENEVKAIQEHLNEQLQPLIAAVEKHQVTHLVGCSGAFTSFSSIIENEDDQEDQNLDDIFYEFRIEDFLRLSEQLVHLNLEQRLDIKGLVKQRAPMIVVGAILVSFVLDKLNVTKFELSKYALKEGAIFDFLKEQNNG